MIFKETLENADSVYFTEATVIPREESQWPVRHVSTFLLGYEKILRSSI